MFKNKKLVLIIIVLAQFFCTSLWFAGNAVAIDLSSYFNLDDQIIGLITSMVQFGFIVGTLLFAFLKIADRFSPSLVFLFCALAGALANVSVTFLMTDFLILPLRFLTGFFLAGIYPVGMKIASDYHKKGLGLALGYLVGALVLGTASPHLLRDFFIDSSWQNVFYTTSALAIVGGIMIGFLVSDGPNRKRSKRVDFTSFFRVFTHRNFRSSAFGYFGHMWELYAFWAFVPVYLTMYQLRSDLLFKNVSTGSFFVVGIGALSCILGGYLSNRFGSGRVAAAALSLSLLCCILSPFMLYTSPLVFSVFVLLWGMFVIMDSPQFSTLVARFAPTQSTGTALTIVNSVGFAVTIVSIQLINFFDIGYWMFYILIPGPLIGLLAFIPVLSDQASENNTLD